MEEADHSLPYMVAVALLDGHVLPEQYAPERIRRADVQDLLRRVQVRASADHSVRFPDEVPATVTITLKDGRRLSIDKVDYAGFHTRPMSWDGVVAKFDRLTAAHAGAELRAAIADTVARLERVPAVGELAALLARIGGKEEEEP